MISDVNKQIDIEFHKDYFLKFEHEFNITIINNNKKHILIILIKNYKHKINSLIYRINNLIKNK